MRRYILVYPQGCDVCNHLSLFLCVADYDKLLPGERCAGAQGGWPDMHMHACPSRLRTSHARPGAHS